MPVFCKYVIDFGQLKILYAHDTIKLMSTKLIFKTKQYFQKCISLA